MTFFFQANDLSILSELISGSSLADLAKFSADLSTLIKENSLVREDRHARNLAKCVQGLLIGLEQVQSN